KAAESYFEEENYEAAAGLFSILSQTDPSDSYYKLMLGISYSYLPKKSEESLQILQSSKKENPSFAPIKFHLGRAYAANKQFTAALKSFKEYLKIDGLSETELEKTKNYIRYCENALALMKDSLEVKITNLGSPINTEYEEYV